MSKGKAVTNIGQPRALARACLFVIKAYQRYLSPLKPATCRFYPSCSQYYYEAVLKYGFIRGSLLGIRRLLKCHPFHPGGYDPVS